MASSKRASQRAGKQQSKRPRKSNTRRAAPRAYQRRETPDDDKEYLDIASVLLKLAGWDTQDNLSVRYPELHKLLKRRHRAGPPILSQDNCTFSIRRVLKAVRADTLAYQTEDGGAGWFRRGTTPKSVIGHFFAKLCPSLAEEFTIYGTIGNGTFGFVLAAREKEAPPGLPPDQFAIKVEMISPRYKELLQPNPMTGPYREVALPLEIRYLPVEAIVMQHLTQSDRFPEIDSIYMHETLQATVMSSFALHPKWDKARETRKQDLEWKSHDKYPSCTGLLLTHENRPFLNEIQVCKVSSHLLQGIMYLMDMNMVHEDLSPRNYVVDENLNTELLDLGQIVMGLDDDDFQTEIWPYILAFEYLVPPELVLAMNGFNREFDSFSGRGGMPGEIEARRIKRVTCPHDLRQGMLWKFGVLIYVLLHGYAPWERPEFDVELGNLTHDFNLSTKRRAYYQAERRERILNEELPIREDLSQDCVDMLRMMLAKNIEDRPMSPMELAGMPWFQGNWVDYPPRAFERPPLPMFELANEDCLYPQSPDYGPSSSDETQCLPPG